MKAWIIFFAGIATLFGNGSAGDCDKLPENLDIESCCKFPSFDNDAIVKKVADQFKNQKLDDFMLECKVTEALFKELNLTKDNNIDKDAMLKYVDRVKEANWKPVMKAAVEECYKEVIAKKDDIAKELAKAPFNIKPDQCNSLFMAMITCVHLEGFEQCPKDVWSGEKKCVDAKAWIEKCGDDIDSLKQLAAQKSRKK